MKSFLSSLRKLDSSAHVLRDRIASRRQFQLFTALKFMKSEKRLDKKLEMTSSWASQSRRIARASLTITLFGKVVLGIFAVSTFPASAAPVTVNVCFKTGSELDLNSTANANTKAKLTNAVYFGTGGTAAPESFVFKTLASVTAATLNSNGCQIYFGGGSTAQDVTSTEATALATWRQTTGHFLLAGCDYPGNVICSSSGRTLTSIANGGVSINSLLSYNPLTCGGALSIGTYGGASTYLEMLAGDSLLAKHNTALQQPAAITDSLVTPTFLFTADADMYGSNGASAVGAGATASTDQAKFVVNSFKFGLDAIKGRLGNPQCFASYDQKADLALSISTSNASPVVGGQTTVTVTVVNQSLNNVTGVAAIVNLPAGLSLASQTGIGSYSAANQSWSIGSLNGGASATITLTLDVTSAGSLTIPAQISQSSLADIDSSTNVGFGVDDLNDGIADDDEASVVLVSAAPAVSNPNLLLVKRITAINGNTTNGNIFLNTYDPETDTTNSAYPYDKNVILPGLLRPNSDKWPNTSGIPPISSTFLLGARNGGTTKPNDSIEYTIYFLSAGDSAANNVLFCDRVPANTTFIPNAFNAGIPDSSGLPTADRGIAISLGSTLKSYTNINDGDIARYYPPLSEPINDFPKINCGGANTNGAVVVNLGNRPNATGTLATDNAAGAYGFVRFRGVVK